MNRGQWVVEAQEDAPEVAEPHYNAANSHYRLQDYEQAQGEIEQALVGEERQVDLDQSSYYNLGNVFFETQQYETAIEAYKEALRLNPDDLQAKQNLELALRQLEQQQQDQQQNQDQQDQQQDDQQQEGEGDQQQDQQQDGQQDQQQDDQQDQAQDSGEQDGQQDQQQDQQGQDGQQDEPQDDGQQPGNQGNDASRPEGEPSDEAGGQPQPVKGLTREQARQLLEAAAQGTESLEEFLQQILVFPGAPPAEDW
jgi:Ca-activated chloride channel family protein